MDISVFHPVVNKIDAHNWWTKLEGLCQRKTAQNKVFLIKRLVNLKLKGARTITEHLSVFQGIVNQLSTLNLFWVNSCKHYFS